MLGQLLAPEAFSFVPTAGQIFHGLPRLLVAGRPVQQPAARVLPDDSGSLTKDTTSVCCVRWLLRMKGARAVPRESPMSC